MKSTLIGKTAQYLCYRQTVLHGSTNCYILQEREECKTAIIDPGGDALALIRILEELNAQPTLIINTHGHWDHIGANKHLQQHYGLDINIHEADAPMLADKNKNAARFFAGDGDGGAARRLLQEGDIIGLGALEIEVLHTPGHTPGGICLKLDKLLFSGDTLFKLSIGRTDLAGGDYDAITCSLARLATLPDDLLVLPGHGDSSILGYEKKHNPYLRD